MKTLRYAALALAVSGVFTLGARAGDTTNEWWNVDFEALAPYVPNDPAEAMIRLTNDFVEVEGSPESERLWPAGLWKTQDGDETIVTNSYFPTNHEFKAFGQDTCLKLDTQGNDLTWELGTNGVNDVEEEVKYLVDADLYLVGSDSAPDKDDFDKGEDVQTAIYLKNETDEDSGETTNSVLCVYVRDAKGQNYWQELEGVKLEDNAWAHVQVLVDHSAGVPKVYVYVNNTQMMGRGGNPNNPDDWKWTVANLSNAQTVKKINSVSFRGTGAVDNFAGVTIETTYDEFDFAAEVYMDGTNVAATATGVLNKTQVVEDYPANRPYTFEGFMLSDFDYDNYDTTASWSLTRIEIIDPATGATTTYDFSWDGLSQSVVPPEGMSEEVVYIATDDEFGMQTGGFTVTAPTAGATADSTIVRVYFETLPAEGEFKLKALQNVGTPPADQTFNTNSLAVNETTFTFAQTLADGGKNYILSTITVGDTPAGIEANPSGQNVVVTVPLSDQIAEGVYTVATANYVEGTLAEGQELRGSRSGNVYTFEAYVPPVAIIVAGGVTNEYDSLRGAITNAAPGATIYLVADDRVSFTEANPEIAIVTNLTIDGGNHTLYGVTTHVSPSDGSADHDVYIGGNGNVTIKNLVLSEFSDSVQAAQQRTTPIWVGKGYTGKLTLDGVTVTNFNRTAFNLGGGTFEITNCVIAGCYTPETTGDCFQSAIEVFNANGTVAETTVTGIGSTIEREGSSAASCFTLISDWSKDPWEGGTGSITVLSGFYAGQYIGLGMTNAESRIVISNGTFVASAPAADEAFGLDGEDPASSIAISGGWFDREPEAGYLVAGYVAVQDADHAPVAAAPWTVKAAAVQIEGVDGGAWVSIADAQEAAEVMQIADPTFVIVAPLSAETVTLATADATLKVKTDDTGFLANLEVVTSLAGSDAVEYSVEPRAVGMEPPITVTYMVVPTYYVAKIVDGATTNKYGTFTAAATVAMAETPTLVVEMVANTNAQEDAFAITGSLKVKAGGFLIPELVPEDRSHYLDASEPDENGVVTYRSRLYLTATFLNGDGSVLETVEFLKAGDTPMPTKDNEVEPYPAAQPGYWITHLYNWSPALGPIPTNTTFHPLFTTNITQYSIQYVLGDDATWPAGYTPPEWYAVTNATIELPTPVKDGWEFKGWYTNKTEGVYVGDLMNPGVIPTGSYGPKFFYAEWTQVYTITVELNGGEWETVYTPPASYTADSPAISIPNPVREGFSFDGWTNEVGVVVEATIPTGSTGNKFFGASWTEDSVEPPEVDVGDDLLAADGAPMEFDADGKCTVRFRAPAKGVYVLMSSTTVNGTYTAEEAVTATKTVTDLEDNLVELTEGTAGTTKFFKIGWSAE